jgi:hypothetical protein
MAGEVLCIAMSDMEGYRNGLEKLAVKSREG